MPEAERGAFLGREDRAALAFSALDAGLARAVHAAARAGALPVSARGGEALVCGPTLLLREMAADLPPELGAAVRRALEPAPAPPTLRHARGTLLLDRPVVMGVVNVTPDSFSDGGVALGADAAVARGVRLIEDGAAIVDVGGESTRPGATPVALEEELRRVVPVIERLAARGAIISIDTRKAAVARRAIAAGAAIVNDVSALGDPDMAGAIADSEAGVILMHMRGTPETMQEDPRYADLLGEVCRFLMGAARRAQAAGIAAGAIALDPGFGFGKTAAHNIELLRRLSEIVSLGHPVAVGLSRKSTLGAITGRPVGERLAASIAAAALAASRGARIVRAHDVRETADALAVAHALAQGLPPAANA